MDNDIIATYTGDELLSRNKTISMRDINLEMTRLFQRYAIALNKIQGGSLIGSSQVQQIQDMSGSPIEYGKGSIVFKNGIDHLQYLIHHRGLVAGALGLQSQDIYSNRRDLGRTSECLAKLNKTFDLGDADSPMQLYISRRDNNASGLQYLQDWTDYIFTQEWIDQLVGFTTGQTQTEDVRIHHISDMIDGMVSDHEIDYHKTLAEFDANEFLNSGKEGSYDEALNKLNSFDQLNYCFYEMFKPIGGKTSEKYIKVRVFTSGEMEVSGVVGLADCEHLEWEYGSRDYLRSLNTGNQRYLFRLSIPFNDENSILYWRPDEKEQLEKEDPDDENEEPKYRYYKPYETERFLRWFGTNYIPMLDQDSIVKATICSIPQLSNDVYSDNFYGDATNILNADMAKANIDSSTSQSLLTLAPKSTVEIVNLADETHLGQYIQFIVGGHQQTSNIAFHIRGKMLKSIQEMNHFAHTWNFFTDVHRQLGSEILFLQTTSLLNPDVEQAWEAIHPGTKFIPDDWMLVADRLKKMRTPTPIDLLRMRQIDLETIVYSMAVQDAEREEFIQRIGSETIVDANGEEIAEDDLPAGFTAPDNVNQFHEWRWYLDKVFGKDSSSQKSEWMDVFKNSRWYNDALYQFIHKFGSEDISEQNEVQKMYELIPIAKETRDAIILHPLQEIYETSLSEEEQEARKTYDILFDGITQDELRERITTFNNLIVRLPTDTEHNRTASRHIFLDWKAFVDGAVAKMLENGANEPSDAASPHLIPDDQKLYAKRNEDGTLLIEYGPGTDKNDDGTWKMHEYVELYTSPLFENALIDYSYCYEYNEEGEITDVLHDRWDFWSEDDFI